MYEEAAGILHELAWNMELHDMRGNSNLVICQQVFSKVFEANS